MGNNKHGVLNMIALALVVLAAVFIWKQHYTLTYFTLFVAFMLRRQAKEYKRFYDIKKQQAHADE